MEPKTRKCFRCGSEDHMIAKCTKLPKDNEKRQNQVRLNEKVNRACDNSENKDDQKIYASMVQMPGNEKRSSEKYDNSSQLINSILDSVAMCHMLAENRISFQDH